MHRLDSMAKARLHPDILSHKIHNALGNPGCCSWAAGVQKQYSSLGMTSPFSGGHFHSIDHLAFHKAMLVQDMSFWEGLSISPCGAPPPGAKLCTYLRWFARLDKVNTEPYYELPLPVTKLRSIVDFGVDPHSYQYSRAGLGCQRCQDICADAHLLPQVMRAPLCFCLPSLSGPFATACGHLTKIS